MNRLLLPTALFVAVLVSFPSISDAADHREAPLVRTNGALDINDLYVFESLENSNNAVLVMTVNPFAGNLSGTTFQSTNTATYEFQIDNTGDSVADVFYTTSFAAAVGNNQTYNVTRRVGAGVGVSIGAGVTNSTVGSGLIGGGQVTAGQFDDPFFFDFDGFNNGFAFTGTDFFAGANVSGIVLEVPKTDLMLGSAGTMVGVQAVTSQNGAQFDRMGRPAIATALLPTGVKDAFNAGDPVDDPANFGDEVNTIIASLSSQANADALTPVLLPDLLTYDTSNSGGFLNGRQLQNDVIDASLNLVSAGAITTDLVDANDRAFLSIFPYLASPNAVAVPEPTTTGLLVALGVGAIVRRRCRNAGSPQLAV